MSKSRRRQQAQKPRSEVRKSLSDPRFSARIVPSSKVYKRPSPGSMNYAD